jgi:hypothetical protein
MSWVLSSVLDVTVDFSLFFKNLLEIRQNPASLRASQPHNRMKSKKNLTRFDYENSAFEGWRLCITQKGASFVRYFPDKKLGGPKKSLVAAEKALKELKELLGNAKLVDNKHSATTIKKAQKLLKDAV